MPLSSTIDRDRWATTTLAGTTNDSSRPGADGRKVMTYPAFKPISVRYQKFIQE